MLPTWSVLPRMIAFLVLCVVFVVNDSDGVRNEEQCTCIQQCKMVTYWSEVSAARLSVSDILVRMRHKVESSAAPNFRHALEIAERVSEDSMQQTVQLMLDVLQSHHALNSLIQFYVVSDKTSLRTLLLKFNDDIQKMLQHSITTSLSLHGEMHTVYTNYVDYLVTDLTTPMQAANRLFADVCKGFVIRSDFESPKIQSLSKMLAAIVRKLGGFDTNLNVTSIYARQLFPKRLVNTTTCLSARKKLNTTLTEQQYWLAGFPNASTFDTKVDLVKVSNARSLLLRTTKCMLAYKNELEQFSTWLKSIQMPTIANTTLTKSQLEAFQLDGDSFRGLMVDFVSGSVSKSELAQRYLLYDDKRMRTNAQQLIDEVKESTFHNSSTR